jgi:hypothetical protein
MNEWTCAEAAKRGDTEMLRWLVDNGLGLYKLSSVDPQRSA